MYQHYNTEENLFSLHDCCAERISFEEGTLSFYFPDGFWILDTHPQNELNNIVKSDASKVEFSVGNEDLDGVEIYIFTERKSGNVIREEWEPERFIKAVNNDAFQVEFIAEYKSYQSLLYKCWIWFEQEPYHKECEITISTDKVTYCWNKLCEDRVW